MFGDLSLRAPLGAFFRATRGNMGLLVAGAVPVLFGLAALTVDFTNGHRARSALQEAADGAALAAASELRLRSTSESSVNAAAAAYVGANMPAGAHLRGVQAATLDDRSGVRVRVSASFSSVMGRMFRDEEYVAQVEAVARLSGGTPLCALALEELQGNAVYLNRRARILAPECAVVSNSASARGIVVRDSSQLNSLMVCSAGGLVGDSDNFENEPLSDCPAIPDPLAGRPEPAAAAGGCDFAAVVQVIGVRTLSPGTYCGGIVVLPNATLTLQQGVYVMRGGPLIVMNRGSLVGEHVGFYFDGNLAIMRFEPQSRIDLSAPRAGDMAGFLFFSSRAPLGGALNLRRFVIGSNDARTLLGTIYLRDGILEVNARRPIADRSAYTVVVARRIEVTSGPDLVLNADYDSTDIPVPNGVGPREGQAFLSD